jgi:hypothetical protein
MKLLQLYYLYGEKDFSLRNRNDKLGEQKKASRMRSLSIFRIILF